MRKQTALLTLLFVCTVSAVMAQKSSLKGTITDTLNKQNLSNAVITVLRAKDSVLVKFTRTDAQGNFELKNLNGGDFILMVSYPAYADYVEKINIQSGIDRSLGNLPVITKANLLQEVIVKQRIGAIRVKGDTTEYRADSFHVSANADVQELLRKMPGIQVNSKGEITAQGEKVEKILVDGEEFFSDDPAVVTKNLRADAVDKIQAFDKKSDQATFTGIDDGQKIKTLNIQLKEDKKKGYFGKVELGSDFTRYNYGKALLNAFKGKRKISGYVTSDNTKFESLSWEENRNYGGDASTTSINDDGGVNISFSGDDFSWGRGFPKSVTGGLHFSNKWDKDKHNSNNTYQYNDLNVTGTTITTTSNLIPGSEYSTYNEQSQVSNRTRHKLTSIYEWQIDSSSSLKVTFKPQTIKSLSKTNYLNTTRDGDGNLISESNRTTTSNDQNNTLNGNVFWRKKFKKAGRTISLNSDLSFGDREESILAISTNKYYDKTGSVLSTENIDQMKINKQRTSSINSLVTYTEPLWKNTFLVLNYRLNLSQNNAERNTFAKNGAGKYEDIVDTLSNHFIFNTTGHQGGFNIRYNVKKVNFSLGTGVGNSVYHMTDLYKNTSREVSFTNFVPSVTFNYTPKQQRRVTLTYTGNTRNPTLQQIQPLVDNIDPQNITIGNPDLKQSFTHNFNFRASDYKVLKSKSMSISANLSLVENAISNSSDIDTVTLKRINKAVNVSGNYNFYSYLSYGFDLIPSLNVGLNAGPSMSRYANIVNKVRNSTETKGINLGMYAGYWADKWINFWMNFNANYNSSVSSVRPDITTAYWQYNTYSNVQLKFKKIKTYVDLNLQATVFQKTAAFAAQQDSYIFSPSIRKIISKDDKWEAKVAVNDLFNQNRGINRSVSSNFISETINQTIQRYVLFSLVYNFSKNGKPTNGF